MFENLLITFLQYFKEFSKLPITVEDKLPANIALLKLDINPKSDIAFLSKTLQLRTPIST